MVCQGRAAQARATTRRPSPRSPPPRSPPEPSSATGMRASAPAFRPGVKARAGRAARARAVL